MRLRLGYDTYSLRSLHWNAFQHLEFASQQGIDAIQFSSLDVFESLDSAYLDRVKARAEERGIAVDAGIGCICELSKTWRSERASAIELLKEGIFVARSIGAKVLRCVMGNDLDRSGAMPMAALMEATARNLRAVRSQALDAQVAIAIENHKDLQAWQARQLIELSGADFVGATVDIGNPLCLLEHPMTTLERLGEYAVTSHIRDTAVYETQKGAEVQWTALGEGSVDLKEIVCNFARLAPGCSLHLEIITGRSAFPLPYLEPSFWNTFRGMPAEDLARFIALAKRGHRFEGEMTPEPAAWDAVTGREADALRSQQRHDLERSLRYAKKVLGVGLSAPAEACPMGPEATQF